MKGQSRRMSLVEQVINIGSGLVLALMVGQIVYPLYGYPVTLRDNLALSVIFTVVSIVRGYVWRRIFNRLNSRKAGWA